MARSRDDQENVMVFCSRNDGSIFSSVHLAARQLTRRTARTQESFLSGSVGKRNNLTPFFALVEQFTTQQVDGIACCPTNGVS